MYRNCPHCRASNRATDVTCYSCEKPMEGVEEPKSAVETLFDSPTLLGGSSSFGQAPAWHAISAMAGATAFGAGLGLLLEAVQPDLPFGPLVLMLGALVAVVTSFTLGKIQDLPPGLMAPRVLPALPFGLMVGAYLWGLWWSFEPTEGWLGIGAAAGFFVGSPIAFSFGLAGGKSRPLGRVEWTNFLVNFCMAVVFGFFLGIDDFDMAPGIIGGLGLLAGLLAGRVNLWHILSAFNELRSQNSDD